MNCSRNNNDDALDNKYLSSEMLNMEKLPNNKYNDHM